MILLLDYSEVDTLAKSASNSPFGSLTRDRFAVLPALEAYTASGFAGDEIDELYERLIIIIIIITIIIIVIIIIIIIVISGRICVGAGPSK